MEKALFQKLKLDKFEKIAWLQKAKEVSIFDDLEIPLAKDGETYDLLLAYVYSLEDMKTTLLKVIQALWLRDKGFIYLMYPKMKNPLGYPPIGRDDIFPYLEVDDAGFALKSNLKFQKMNKIDDTYTLVGLKLSPLTQKKTQRPSQRVDDYLDKVADIKSYLKAYPKAESFYETLAQGYQKDWARYIYTASKEETILKRQGEMVSLLEAGFKTKELYRQSLKKKNNSL